MSDPSNANILIIKADDIPTSKGDHLLSSNSVLQCCLNPCYMSGTMVNICVRVCSAHTCSLEAKIGWLSLSFPTLFFWDKSSTEPGAGNSGHIGCSGWPASRWSRIGCLPRMAPGFYDGHLHSQALCEPPPNKSIDPMHFLSVQFSCHPRKDSIFYRT